MRDPGAIADALDGVTAVSHQAAMVGLGVDLSDIADYVSHNDLGTATLLKALAARGFDGPLVLASSMVVYGEGRYRCPEHGIVRPGPRTPERPRRRPLRAALPGLRTRPRARGRARGRPARPAQRLRRDQGRAGAPVRRVRARDGRDRDRAALPQRLRPADAARHALRRRREPLPLRARRRPAAARVRGRRPAERLRPRARRRPGQPPALEAPTPGAFNVASGTPRSVGEMAEALAARSTPAGPGRHGRVARRRRPPRVRLAQARGDDPRLPRGRGLRGRHA